MAINFRKLFYHITPSFAHEGEGETLYWSLAWFKDYMNTRARRLIDARFPTRSSNSARTQLGDDRGIPRGPSESGAAYGRRLTAFRYPRGHRVKGNAFELLAQLSGYFGGIRCATIDFQGTYHERSAAGVESVSFGNTWDWDGTPSTPVKARFWVFLWLPITVTPQPPIGDPTLWDGEIGTPGFVIGQNGITPQTVVDVKRFFRGSRAWKPHGSRAMYAIVVPTAYPTLPAPDGTWDDPANRNPDFFYWSLGQ
jgi:hypothetical protein